MTAKLCRYVAAWVFAGIAAIVLLLWLGSKLLLPDLIRDEIRKFGQSIAYQIEVGQVQVLPLSFSLVASDLKISSAREGALLAVDSVSLTLQPQALLAGELHFAEIQINAPQITLKHIDGKQPTWNWIQLIEALAGPKDASPSALKVAIDGLHIKGARLSIDHAQRHDVVGPFSFSLEAYRNVGDDGRVGGLSSTYTVNLGKLKLPLSEQAGLPPRALQLNHVAISGKAHQKAEQDYRIQLDAQIDTGKVLSFWDINAQSGDVKAQLRIEGLPIAPFITLVPVYKPLQTVSGTLDATLDLNLETQQIALSGAGEINDLDIRIVDSKDSLLGWDKAQIDQFSMTIPASGVQTGALTIQEITLLQPVGRLEIDAQRGSNLRQLFTPSGEQPPARAVQAADPAFLFNVRVIRLQNGRLHFADRSIRPEFAVDINALNGYFLGVSNQPEKVASLALDGRVGKAGSLRGRGQLAFDDPRLNNDVSLRFKDVSLKSINPYTMTFAGYQIERGRMDANLHYVTKNGTLQGENRFVIRKIQLGDEVPDYQGARLPLGLAIALLEDSDGMIDVNIPVEGNVNDPDFSLGHLVWQAVKTVLNNLISAPFRAIGTLLGIDNLRQISFPPGESALSPADQQSLARLAIALADRPGARVMIRGGYDPDLDAQALARAMADRAILAAAGLRIEANDPLPTPNLSDPETRAALKSAYANQLGRIKLGQRLLMLPDTPERDQQLHQELMDSFQIGETQLLQLANERARQSQQAMMAAAPGISERLDLGAPVQIASDGSSVREVIEILPVP